MAVVANTVTWCNHSKYEKKTQKFQNLKKVAKQNIFVTFLMHKFKLFSSKYIRLRQDCCIKPTYCYCKKTYHILKQRPNFPSPLKNALAPA